MSSGLAARPVDRPGRAGAVGEPVLFPEASGAPVRRAGFPIIGSR